MNSFTFLIKLVLQSDRYQKVDAIRNLREQLKAAQKHAMEIRASQAHIRQAHTRYNAYMRDVHSKETQARKLLADRMQIQRRLMDLEARHKITQSTTGYLKNRGLYDGIYNRAKLSLRSQGIANDQARRAAMGSLNNARASAPFSTGQLRQLIIDGRKVGLDKNGLRNVLQGKAPLPSGSSSALQDAIGGKIGMLQQALSNLSRAAFVLQSAFIAIGTFIKVELLGMLGQAISHFSGEIMTTLKLTIFSKMRQFLEPFGQIRQMEIPLEILTGLSRKSIEGNIREVANLPAVDFLSAGRGLLDLINADPKHDMNLATNRLKTLANAVFAAGGGPEQLDFVTLAIKQMMGKDKISGQEIRQQIAQHIPSVFRFTKEQYGTSDIRELNNMNVGTEDFVNKLIAWLERNTPALPMSPQTMLENLDDRILQTMAGVGEGIFNTIQPHLQEVINTFDEMINNGAFQSLGVAFANLTGMSYGLAEGIKNLRDTLEAIVVALNVFKIVIFGFGYFLKTFIVGVARVMEAIFNPAAAAARAAGMPGVANMLDLTNPLTAGFGVMDEALRTLDLVKWFTGSGFGSKDPRTMLPSIKDSVKAGIEGAVGGKGGGGSSIGGNMLSGLDELTKSIQQKPSADEIIMGGNDARRIVTPADLSSIGRKANPTINVQVKSVDLFGRAIQEMVFDVVTDIMKQGFVPG